MQVMPRPPRALPLALALASAALALAGPAHAQQSEGDLGPAVLERLAPLREEHRLPALGGLVIARGEVAGIAVTGSRALGAPDAVVVDDPWHLGSCTKAMTATLAARLVERGALRWDLPLGDALPDLAAGMEPAWRAVTLEQLLAHRAGAPRDLLRDPLWRTLFLDATTPLPELRRQVVTTVTARPPESAAGERFAYSNVGYAIAGAAIERAGGAPYEQLLRAELFEPLGLAGAGFGPPGSADRLDAPRGHRRQGGELVAVAPGTLGADNPPAIAPAGTVHARLRDWGAFARLHLRGARGEEGLLLRPETFRALHAARGADGGYALGWGAVERDWAGGRALTHSGSNTMWFCTIVVAPDANAAALAVTNCGDASAEAACAAAVKALLALARSR